MPCGQLDRRRVGHRCTPCKRSHAKCNGDRPCSNCVARGLECASSGTSAGSSFQFVHHAPSIPRALVQDSWRYISTYFQSIGSLTQASVLRSAAVTAMSHEDENVSRTLSILGGLYASQNPHVLRISAKERRGILNTWVRQKAIISMELKKPATSSTSSFSPILLSALLLAVIELILDLEEGAFHKWLPRISSYITTHMKMRNATLFTPLERALLRFFDFLNILAAIALKEIPLEPQISSEYSSVYPAPSEPLSDDNKVDEMLSILLQWAKLQHRMIAWILSTEGRDLSSQPEGSDISREAINIKVQGLDIICEASTLQARIISNLVQLSQEPGNQVSTCITPYYHWALTGLSHRLRYDAWKLLMCELPIMPASVRHQQALVALGCVETLVGQSGLDVALYLPFAEFVGHEMETVTEQTRMLAFLDVVKGRGFEVAVEYRKHLLEAWQPRQEDWSGVLFCDQVKSKGTRPDLNLDI